MDVAAAVVAGDRGAVNTDWGELDSLEDTERHNCTAYFVTAGPVGRTYFEHVAHGSEETQQMLASWTGECGISEGKVVASGLLPSIQAFLLGHVSKCCHDSPVQCQVFQIDLARVTNLEADTAPVPERYTGLDDSRNRRPLAVFVRWGPVRVEGRATDAEVGDRAGKGAVSCRLRSAEVATVDAVMRDAVAVVVERYWRGEDAVNEEAGPVEDDGDDAVDTFNQSLFPNVVRRGNAQCV